MPERRWRAALPSDLRVIAGWIDSPQALERWAGPGLSWPPEPATLWREFGGGATPAFTLREGKHPVAFGQLVPKATDHWHLARLIVAPERRGQGLGRSLCQHLLAQARQRQARCVTLNVFRDNLAALALYQALGFVDRGTTDARGIQPMWLPRFADSGHTTDNECPEDG
ncbi:GNAT family N-acetyltransferase [Salinicola endophyticus]|uniref:GNAT family N-acetyltransferase n=1 Tax=Salinicola endophyticus TaxID=1949083 RepID=A0AB74U7S1_9GAMM